MSSVPATAFRSHVPLLARMTYVNSCSQGALSLEVTRALQEFTESWNLRGSPWEQWVERHERLRIRFAASIGADPDEVAVMPSASVGISAVMSALRFDGERRDLCVGEFEFPTMGHVLMAQQQRGARIRWVRARGNVLPLEAYAAMIDERTKLVPASHVCFKNGYRLDLPGLAALCRDRGAYLFLDDYQSTGTHPLDVHALGIDFMVTGSLKYLLGSSGVAFLYVRRDLVEQLEPTITGWFGRVNPFAFAVDVLDWSDSARRFEMGTPAIPNIYAALAGLELLESFGQAAVHAQITRLVDRCIDGCRSAGYAVLTPTDRARRGPLIVLRATDATTLAARLEARGVVGSARGAGLRLSFHGYNNDDDVSRILEALAAEADLIERPLHVS
jgi:selenocysteine lyase/cysteine desulfurase